MAENLIKSDEELGLNKKIHPYTGFYLVDFILNHHMTPLFTLFVATAIFRYMYSAGLIFPLDELERRNSTNLTEESSSSEKSSSTTTTKSDANASTNSASTNTAASSQVKQSMSTSSSKTKSNEFLLGIVWQRSNDADRRARQDSIYAAAKRVKGVRVVVSPKISNQHINAVFVSSDDPKFRFEHVQQALKAKRHVLVDILLGNTREEVRTLRALSKKWNVHLIQATPARFVASWERLFSSVHAEVGVVQSITLEYVTGPIPRCVEKMWNRCCRCSCMWSCCHRGTSKRSRESAAPALSEAALESMSMLHELLSDVAGGESEPMIVTRNNGGVETQRMEMEGTYSRGGGKNEEEKDNDKEKEKAQKENETMKWRCASETSSWKMQFPTASVSIVGTESDVFYQWYDSIRGNQSIQVQSKHGFSHTDRVPDVYDAWTMTLVTFVRAVKFQEPIDDMLKSTEMAMSCLNK